MPGDNDQNPNVDANGEAYGPDVPVGEMVGRLEAQKIAAELEQIKSAGAKSRREFAITLVSLSIAGMAVFGPMFTAVTKQISSERSEFGPAYARFMVALNQSARQLNASESEFESKLQELEQTYYELEPYVDLHMRNQLWSLYQDYVTFCRQTQDLRGDSSQPKAKERAQAFVDSFREILLRL
jgi:hypothetical protein